MTSSTTSTDGAARHRRTTLLLGAALGGLAVAGVVVWVLAQYRFRVTAMQGVLVAVWAAGAASIAACALFLVRAAQAFDLTEEPGGAASAASIDERRRDELGREKKLLLKAIKEVEFDQALGKIDDTDAQAAVSRYRGRALAILGVLESDKPVDYAQVIEKELARRLGKRGQDDLARRAAEKVLGDEGGAAAATAACPACQTANDPDAVFCKKCATPLGEEAR